VNNLKTSPALAAAMGQEKNADDSLYRQIPDTDAAVLKAYLEGDDANGKPYFSRGEKINFIRKWKAKNAIKEVGPAFSTAYLNNKNTNPDHMEFQRLLMMIKDEDERNQIEREANHWSLSNNKPAYKYVASFLADQMQMLQENENGDLVLELNHKTLDESFLRSFGWIVKKVLERMFGSSGTNPIKVRGTQSQIDAFSSAASSEKRYMDMISKYGLDSPHTFRNKSALEQAVSKFERATGITWPFSSGK